MKVVLSKLTCSSLDLGGVSVGATAGADGDGVQTSWHEAAEFRAQPGHIECVQNALVVFQADFIMVHVSWCGFPRDVEEIWTSIVGDRHFSHDCWHLSTNGGIF